MVEWWNVTMLGYQNDDMVIIYNDDMVKVWNGEILQYLIYDQIITFYLFIFYTNYMIILKFIGIT